ncbi:hypothetical protein [Streptomyces nigrescens]|uniref:hypothetical protein n=1 Tax=Streptomyces TaxID=1883 RepID=UPI000823846E|nr:hypothetical protein DKG71_41590 [Streptomyces sp. NEAU-S7GS2]MYT11180.1 hypothetical protein [Streptomyces sp. SID4951]SCK07397.1 hypothetical protein YWIDRAFT_00367 [Streptomyces sp. SceaMP-e96]
MTVQETGPLTTESGAPVADSQCSEQAGVGGPAPVRDRVPLETPARPGRERPHRVCAVRAVSSLTSAARPPAWSSA